MLRGLSSPDDAAVLKLTDELSLVATTDFFAPVVDDAYQFGAIAAANALSDIYAMGAEPKLALNLAGFPKTLDIEILNEIFRGGADKVRESGAAIAGGHTTFDEEPKYGLAVMGLLTNQKAFANEGAKPGDQLLLTKPIGTGIITTALKQGKIEDADIEEAVASMSRLNAGASKILRQAADDAVHAVTDITGFSLVGHGHEMAQSSGVALDITFGKIPLLKGTDALAEKGVAPGGADRNRDHFGQWFTRGGAISDAQETIVFDPQTSGGLLVALDPAAFDAVTDAFAAADEPAWHVGAVVEGPTGFIHLK